MLGGSLRRLAVAAGQRGLGFGGPSSILPAAAALACGSSSSSSRVCSRGFADGAGDNPQGEAAAAAAADSPPQAAAAADGGEAAVVEAAAGSVEEQAEPEPVHEALLDFHDGTVMPKELYTKRQLAWMGVEDPDKHKHFLPRLSRKELGSFADEYVSEEFEMEQEMYPEVPEDKALYNLRDSVPEIFQPTSHLFERVKRLKEDQYAGMPVEQFVREGLGIDLPEEQPPRPGARRIIRWQVRHVFAVGVNESHPANKKVKAWVHLRELQREHGLSDAALQHIAVVCGPRYNPNTGVLKLTSDGYAHREANRAHILQMVNDLVEEGHCKFPAAAAQEQQATAA